MTSSITQNGLVIKNLINKPIDLNSLKLLKNDASRLKCLYKKFFRLRNMVDSKEYNISRFQELLRRRFSTEDFNSRRQIVLGKPNLTNEQLLQRMLNTLVFLHNSTVILPENEVPKLVNFYTDSKTPQRIEKLVILTLLQMEYQKPPDIKYSNYTWYSNINHQYQTLPDVTSKKVYRTHLPNPSYIAFRDFELDLMILNETYDLCL